MAKKNVGGIMKVSFAQMGGETISLTVKRTAKLAEALTAAGYTGDLMDIRLNGREVTETSKLTAGDYISVVAAVSGGR